MLLLRVKKIFQKYRLYCTLSGYNIMLHFCNDKLLNPTIMDNRLDFAKTITRVASFYNASALIFFLIPGGLSLIGVQEPYSSFWRVLPALLASFGAITLWISSSNLRQFSAFPAWNGVIRIIFATVALTAGYASSVGQFILLLAIGDFFIGLLTIILVKQGISKSFIDLLLNR